MKLEHMSISRGYRMAGRVLFALALIYPAAAHAYVGPGAGLTAIGTVVALIAALLLAVVGFVWYPIKRFRQRRNADPQADPQLVDTPRDRK